MEVHPVAVILTVITVRVAATVATMRLGKGNTIDKGH
jgi:hypothetical protein